MIDAARIDDLLAAPKSIVGAPSWVRDPHSAVVKLVAPLATAGVVGGLSLYAHANLNTDPQGGGCSLVYDGRPITRLTIKPNHAHANPFSAPVTTPGRGITLPAGPSRLHPWTLNRTWPRPLSDNLPFAEALPYEPSSFAEALTIFAGICGIEGAIPPPPWEPLLL